MKKIRSFVCGLTLLASTLVAMEPLQVSENGHYLVDGNGDAFFWMGDTAWLLFKGLNREDAERYLEDRKEKGFNVIQAMVIHDLNDSSNAYGVSATEGRDFSKLYITPGDEVGEGDAYDYWDHVEYIVQLAESKGLYMGLVALWGSNVGDFDGDTELAKSYGAFLAKRFGKYSNIIWLNGGDVDAAKALDVWDAVAEGIRSEDKVHLMTFHPRGRMHSSMWFHDREWLDFNMFQSGHRRYFQDDTDLNYGEDNWRWVQCDWNLKPTKPTLDGEPSYEGTPFGLHHTHLQKWDDDDVRRYAYWSVFAGGAGFTYGHNSIMQFYELSDEEGAFGARTSWRDELNAPGAWQMRYLRRLMESRPMLERIPAQELIAYNPGDRYDYLIATRGSNYGYIYTYKGQEIEVQMGVLPGAEVKATWFCPRNGGLYPIGIFENTGTRLFNPLGDVCEGNDWVLILDCI